MHLFLEVLFLLIPVDVAVGGSWFNYRLLRNPGLVNDTAASGGECISKCLSTAGCSAVSWRQSKGLCLRSMCNSLDAVKNTGWNTFIINTSFVEGVSLPASRLEWMLTDTCGNNNLGVVPGPKMNLYSVTYTSSSSAYAGNAPVFSGTTASYGRTDTNTVVNIPLNKTSLTVMGWLYFNTAASMVTFWEFSVGTSSRRLLYWLLGGGLWYDFTGASSCSGSCGGSAKSFSPTPGVWYHYAVVYDGNNTAQKFYLNTLLVASLSTFATNNAITDTLTIAGSAFDPNGPLSGRVFCVKIFAAALGANEISNAAASCLASRVRFSG